MIQTIIGEKTELTQKFLSDGTRIPVTHIRVPDNTVLQVKTLEKDKYTAAQIGIGKKKHPTKPAIGHVKKLGLTDTPKVIKEMKITAEDTFKPGDILKIEEIFKPGDIVDVTGTTKGKGFAGVVKRHNFRGGPKTHGQSDRERAPGSLGQTTTPGRVYKGKRMAGRMGSDKVTIKNLQVVAVDPATKQISISGVVPGVLNSVVYITKVKESKKFTPLFEEPKPEAPKEEAAQAPVETAPATTQEPEVKETKSETKAEAVQETKKGEEKK